MSANDDPTAERYAEIVMRLAHIEVALKELLTRKRAGNARKRNVANSIAERARIAAERDTSHKPTELDMERARRALRRLSR